MRGLRGLLLALVAFSALTGWTRAQEPGSRDETPSPVSAPDSSTPEKPKPDHEVEPSRPESEPVPMPESEPSRTAVDQEPAPTPLVYLFLNAPANLNELLAMMSKPDFVLVEWDRYQALQEKANAANHADQPAPEIVSAVDLRGILDHERSDLEVEYRIITSGDGKHLVSLGLDGEVVGSATEDGRSIRLEAGPQGGWLAELKGGGEHQVLVRLHPPVRSTSEGSRLDLAIPEAASTKLDLRTRPSVIEARLGVEESIPVLPAPEGEGSLLRAYVSPRPRLDLSWRTRSVEGPSEPALLTAQGEIAIEVQRGLLEARATYEIRAERGSARTIGIKLDPEDELLALEIDGKSAGVELTNADPDEPLTITLPEPVRPDEPRKILVAVRRPLPGTGPAPVTFRGFPMVGLAVQSGLIAVSQSGDLWISGTPGRGLRQVDPRSDLPISLRVQPSYMLAYQFLDQPFELALQVDPSPPWVRVNSKTTVSLGNGESKVDERLEYRISRGRLFQLRIAMPPGLDLDSVGPDDVIESAEVVPVSPDDPGAGQTLILPLTQSARESTSFTLRLMGRQKIDPSGLVEAGVFRPLDASWRGGAVAVLAARNLSVDLGANPRFWSTSTEIPASWPWPSDRPSGRTIPSLWLQHGGDVKSIPLKVVTHERVFEHTSTLDVVVDRHRIDYRQDVDARVRFGTVNKLELAVPPALDKWELEGADLVRRERLGVLESGEIHYRLTLARDLVDRFRLKFQARQERDREDPGTMPGKLSLAPIRLLDGNREPNTIRVSAAPGIEVEPDSEGWLPPPPGDSPPVSLEGSAPVQWIWTETADKSVRARVSIRAQQVAHLPSTVASRLWLRSNLGADGSIHTTAWYRIESHGTSVSVALPEGAEWIQARAGDEAIAEVETRSETSSYRLRLPSRVPLGPFVLILEYVEPASGARKAWTGPTLLDSAVVQQTFWEVRMLPTTALLGVPTGWTDENEWYWDLYVWKRRPRFRVETLLGWVSESTDRSSETDAEMPDGRFHSYLFSSADGSASLQPILVARPWLVAGFSGSVLLIGLVLLARRPPAGLVLIAGLVSALAMGVTVEPSLIFLGLQSSALGLVLVLVASLLQRTLDRGHPTSPMPGARDSGRESLIPPLNPNPALDFAGSDGSTVIRPRHGTTVDHVRTSDLPIAEPVEEPGRLG